MTCASWRFHILSPDVSNTRIMPAGHWGREAIKSDSRTRQHPKLIYLRMKLKEHWRTLSHLHWFGACETLCLSQTWSPNLIDAMDFGRHSDTQNESMGTWASPLCNMRWIGRYYTPELSRWSYTVKSTTNYQLRTSLFPYFDSRSFSTKVPLRGENACAENYPLLLKTTMSSWLSRTRFSRRVKMLHSRL